MFALPVVARQEGQGTNEEMRGSDFRRELENWERTAREKRGGEKHRGGQSHQPGAMHHHYQHCLYKI